jgi:hypothetical protein
MVLCVTNGGYQGKRNTVSSPGRHAMKITPCPSLPCLPCITNNCRAPGVLYAPLHAVRGHRPCVSHVPCVQPGSLAGGSHLLWVESGKLAVQPLD